MNYNFQRDSFPKEKDHSFRSESRADSGKGYGGTFNELGNGRTRGVGIVEWKVEQRAKSRIAIV